MPIENMPMRTRWKFALALGTLAAVNLGCTRSDTGSSPALSIRESRSPAGPGSGEPNLSATTDGRVLLSWVQTEADSRHSLRFSLRDGNRWSDPLTVTSGENWFVNWADFPSVTALDESSLAAHWLVKSGGDPHAYDVHISLSADGGKSWSEAVVPHRDSTKTEHGFVSMLPWADERFLAVWLDGRNFAAATHKHGSDSTSSNEMMLRFATMGRDGRLYNEGTLDERVCDCCQTAAVLTPNGAVVAYRDRSSEEVRDISICRYQSGRWSEPCTLFPDGWELFGCPVNGPAIAARGERVAVAWFTASHNAPHAKVIFSDDEGLTFGPPIVIDDGDPLGRVDVVVLEDASALVCWLESTDEGADIRVRRVLPDGSVGRSFGVGSSDAGRASGFPHMARSGDEVHIAWTQPGSTPVVRTAVAKVNP
jgi:hypothetical protein